MIIVLVLLVVTNSFGKNSDSSSVELITFAESSMSAVKSVPNATVQRLEVVKQADNGGAVTHPGRRAVN